jgi:hypothetical protein
MADTLLTGHATSGSQLALKFFTSSESTPGAPFAATASEQIVSPVQDGECRTEMPGINEGRSIQASAAYRALSRQIVEWSTLYESTISRSGSPWRKEKHPNHGCNILILR